MTYCVMLTFWIALEGTTLCAFPDGVVWETKMQCEIGKNTMVETVKETIIQFPEVHTLAVYGCSLRPERKKT